jgi:hypothetical protein
MLGTCYVTAGTFTRLGLCRLPYDKALNVKGSEYKSRQVTYELLMTSGYPESKT